MSDTFTLEVDKDLSALIRQVIREVLHTGRFDPDDEDRLMDLRDELVEYETELHNRSKTG